MADAAAAGARHLAAASSEPLLTYFPSFAKLQESVAPARESAEFSLQIIGCPSSIGEIHILKTLEAIIAESGGRINMVRVNSIGDRDSRARFSRELGVFMRRHSTHLESAIGSRERDMLLEDPLRAYHSRHEAVTELMREAPRPLHFLSEKSRIHFKQVLEHLERIGFPYFIDDQLIDKAIGGCEPRVLFQLELENGNGNVTASIGGRYDDLGLMSGRSAASVVHASIAFRSRASVIPAATLRRSPLQPKVYFIQFGDSAKLTGFSVIDTLRQARIPVGTQFYPRHLTPQLSTAATIGVPYVLIMGAREALDQTVIVRTLATSAQTTVPICELSKHLRALKLA
jgi:histidyl-tRNA synthetase